MMRKLREKDVHDKIEFYPSTFQKLLLYFNYCQNRQEYTLALNVTHCIVDHRIEPPRKHQPAVGAVLQHHQADAGVRGHQPQRNHGCETVQANVKQAHQPQVQTPSIVLPDEPLLIPVLQKLLPSFSILQIETNSKTSSTRRPSSLIPDPNPNRLLLDAPTTTNARPYSGKSDSPSVSNREPPQCLTSCKPPTPPTITMGFLLQGRPKDLRRHPDPSLLQD